MSLRLEQAALRAGADDDRDAPDSTTPRLARLAALEQALDADPGNPSILLAFGRTLLEAGSVARSQLLLLRACGIDTSSSEIWETLGEALARGGDFNAADSAFARAEEFAPDRPGPILKRVGAALASGNEAAELARLEVATTHDPLDALRLTARGILLERTGRRDEAADVLEVAVALAPDAAEPAIELANALMHGPRTRDAERALRRAMALAPDEPRLAGNLAVVLMRLHRHREALARLDDLLSRHDPDPLTLANASTALTALGRQDDAAAAAARAVSLDPTLHLAHRAYVNALAYTSTVTAAAMLDAARAASDAIDRAVGVAAGRPAQEEAYSANRGSRQTEWVRLRERHHRADASHHRAPTSPRTREEPRWPKVAPRMEPGERESGPERGASELVTRTDRDNPTRPETGSARASFGALPVRGPADAVFASTAACSGPVDPPDDDVSMGRNTSRACSADPAFQAAVFRRRTDGGKPRRARIGLLSPTLRTHPVGWLTIGAFENLDPGRFEIVCFGPREIGDPIERRFGAIASAWHDVDGLSAAAIAAFVRGHEIDALIDLGGYGDRGMMAACAYRAAPVQIKWVGMQSHSSGLPEMDWMLTDRWETPPELARFYRERLLLMPNGYVCYSPPPYAPAVAPPPSSTSGLFTFGCFNNLAKLTPTVIDTWKEILTRCPKGRLILKTHQFDDALTIETIQRSFGDVSDRVSLRGSSPHRDLLAQYADIDVVLDPFPYAGGLTTCEALWMGVPTITLPGETFASRHALSHLANVGLSDWVASDRESYIQLALRKAGDVDAIARLRAGLRSRMRVSPLCDAPRFGRHLGDALDRAMHDMPHR